ncbi:unnamed protein product, partial [Medioppia subpectinata]
GRRPKMEDKFTYVNDSQRLGIEYWAVFDGHGGDVSLLYLNIALRRERWHYVTNPSNSSGVFEVRNVATNELAENGRFVVRNNTTFADTLSFHTDDTGRLVYESGNYIKFYQIFGEKNPFSIRQQFEMKVRFNDKNGVNNGTEITRRVNARREAKKNICYAEKSWRKILATHFENELDMYSILETNTQLGNQKNNGMITICDNNTGEILHEISLGLTLNESQS